MSMKKLLFLMLALGFTVSTFAQFDAWVKKDAKFMAPMTLRNATGVDLPVVGQQTPNGIVSDKSVLTDPTTAVTVYDLQTNETDLIRCYLFPDGTMGATCTWSTQDASWTDRGTGYNYFDGTAWGNQPTARIETIRTGWPNYQPFGTGGELVIAHEATGNLVMNICTAKGTGSWTQTVLPNLPTGVATMLWPRVVTNGPNHTYIHVIALTEPTANGGTAYNGMNGALLYCNSLDGGNTWSNWIQPTGLTSANYAAFGGDTYSFAEPHGDTLAFTIGDGFYDQILEKSTDNGTTWTRTVIWNCPYDLSGSSPHFFYAPDGTNAIALDNSGMAHVAFGLTSDSGTNTAWYYHIVVQGVVYWNEHQSQLRQDLNPDSLYATGNLVAWLKDTNVLYLPATEFTYWGTSLTSNPQLVIDPNNKIFLSYAGATTLLDPNNYNMRHIFGRDGVLTPTGNPLWHNDTLVDITGDWIQYNFAECVYPSASPTTDGNYVYILFQCDDYGGSYVKSLNETSWQGQTTPDNNNMIMIQWSYPIWEGTTEKQAKPTFSVGQNFPNPVNGLTKVNVYLQNSGDLSLKVTNLTGQTLMNMEKSNAHSGVNQFVIDASQLTSGVYFYTVKQGDKSITKKMIVE